MNNIEKIVSQFEDNSTKRSDWEAQWGEISKFLLPNHNVSWSLTEAGDVEISRGKETGNRIFNSTPVIALSRFVGVVEGLLTPIDEKWHTLKPKDMTLLENKDVKDWFHQANELLFDYRYNPGSNFSAQNSMRFEQMGAFGTGLLFIDYDVKETIRYKCIHLKDVVLGQNHQGIVNRVDRVIHMTVLDIIAAFEEGIKLSEKMQAVLGTPKENTQMFRILHATVPEGDDQWGSYYIALDEKILISEGKYSSFPYSVSRYATSPDEVFGRGPGMQVLADIRRLNRLAESILLAIDKTIDPTILTRDNGVISGKTLVMKPNTAIVGGLDHNGRPTVVPFQDGARVDIGDAEIMKLEDSIKDVFLLTLFEIMVETPRMTTLEVSTRNREKAMLLTPLVARQQNESLSPMIERELDILLRHDKIPPLPEGVDSFYDIVFESPLNKMKDSKILAGLIQVVNSVLPMSADNPGMFDIIDMDKAIKLALDSVGVPSVILRSDAEMEERRQQAQQAQEEQVAGEQMVSAAKAAKDLSGVSIDGL